MPPSLRSQLDNPESPRPLDLRDAPEGRTMLRLQSAYAWIVRLFIRTPTY